MNSFATLALNYLLFTLISSGILFAVFRKKLDLSAVYFLVAEIFMAITAGILLLENLQITVADTQMKAIANFVSLSSEVAILFSILSLTKTPKKQYFFGALIFIALFSMAIEWMRESVDVKFIILLYTATQFCLFFSNYFICRYKVSTELEKNQFLILFRRLELGLAGYAAIRMLTYFSDAPVIPRNNENMLAIAVFTVYVALSSFRYMSYIALRMTWVDPTEPTQHFLNRNLVKAIEEKDQLLRGLLASNRMIGISALASSLAHQLSQPLTAIALQAETSRRQLLQSNGDSKLVDSLNEISCESGKLANLVKNLRKLFSTRSDQFHPVNLQRITDEIVEIMEPTLKAKKIVLLKSYQSNPEFLGDSIQIQQVLINIFNNAIDSLSASNAVVKELKISINEDVEKKLVSINIADNGVGIDKELLPDIFNLYKTTKPDGLGVGLWLSRIIIERHHGSITGFNLLNGGAIFEVQLPIINPNDK